MKFYTHKTTSIFVIDVKLHKNPLLRLRDVQFFQTAGVKINGSYYRHAVETTVAASHSFSLWWHLHLPARQCPAHRARETVALLSAETPDFISPMDWPPNRVEHFDCSGWHQLRWKLMTCGWCYLKIHISVKSRRIYMKLRSNVCNRCRVVCVCVKFYLNRSRFAVVVAKC